VATLNFELTFPVRAVRCHRIPPVFEVGHERTQTRMALPVAE
jgi:hypothetical protein